MFKPMIAALIAATALVPPAFAQDRGGRGDRGGWRAQDNGDQGNRGGRPRGDQGQRGDSGRPTGQWRQNQPAQVQQPPAPPQQQWRGNRGPDNGGQQAQGGQQFRGDRGNRGNWGGQQAQQPQGGQQQPGGPQWRGNRGDRGNGGGFQQQPQGGQQAGNDRGNRGDWNRGQQFRGDRDRGQWNGNTGVVPPRVGQGDRRTQGDRGRGRGYGDWRDDNRYSSAFNGNDRRWSGNWRSDRRYDWRGHRSQNRNSYRMPRYYAPRGYNYGYSRFSIGFTLGSLLFAPDYWIEDPFYYRLPPAYGPYRWVRYYNDALLVDIRTGMVVDVEYDIFW